MIQQNDLPTKSLSRKSKELIEMYNNMVVNGYETTYNKTIKDVFNSMEIEYYKDQVKEVFDSFDIKTVLDYGSGGTSYDEPYHLKKFFNLTDVFLYEPSRNIDQRQRVDAVVCFDVLEHIFVNDVPQVIRELFALSKKLLLVNIGCYPARALLPNNENAHITLRSPSWWCGMFECIAPEYPDVNVKLFCTTSYRYKGIEYKTFSANERLNSPNYVVPCLGKNFKISS